MSIHYKIHHFQLSVLISNVCGCDLRSLQVEHRDKDDALSRGVKVQLARILLFHSFSLLHFHCYIFIVHASVVSELRLH